MASKPSSTFITSPLFHLVILLLLPLLIESHSTQQHHHHQHQEPLKSLEGCHKGQTVKGLHAIKQYLEKFGYLPHHRHNKTGSGDDDTFDDSLESAVKTYQLNYHLNVTGILDGKTLHDMALPRCGVPDIVDGRTSMHSGKKRHLRSIHHTVAHFSFFPRSPRWPPSKRQLTYGFLAGVQVIGAQDLRSVCRSAFDRWARVSHFTFQETQDVNTADLKIGFYSRNHGDGASFDGPGRTVAHAFAPTDGRFHFDADDRWAINPVTGAMDVESVAVHEIGHLLGLGHSSVPGAIMFPTISSGVKKVNLHGDDIQGIRTLYNMP